MKRPAAHAAASVGVKVGNVDDLRRAAAAMATSRSGERRNAAASIPTQASLDHLRRAAVVRRRILKKSKAPKDLFQKFDFGTFKVLLEHKNRIINGSLVL